MSDFGIPCVWEGFMLKRRLKRRRANTVLNSRINADRRLMIETIQMRCLTGREDQEIVREDLGLGSETFNYFFATALKRYQQPAKIKK